MKSRVTLLLCHDNVDLARSKAEWYRVFRGINVVAQTTAAGALAYARNNLGRVDVAIIHKDIGGARHERVTVEDIVQTIHVEAPHIRVGIESGEYPDGLHQVLAMRADFYCGLRDLSGWAIGQIKRGMVGRDEIRHRGRQVDMPYSPSRRERHF